MDTGTTTHIMDPERRPARSDREPAGRDPELSVILPVLDEVRDLGPLLDQLRAEDVGDGRFEVLVVDGGSTDGTRETVLERAAAWSALRLLENPGRRSGPGRNVGARAARGRYLLFLDGHCALPRPDYLERSLRLFEESGSDCLCRPQPLDRLAPPGWGSAIAAARHSPLGHNPGSDIYASGAGYTRPESAGAAYRRDVFLALEGYDERFDACEDVEFNRRVAMAGYTAYRHPDLAVSYRPRESLRGLWGQMMRYGRGRARLWARHPGMVPWVLLFVPLLLAAAAAGILVFGVWGAAAVAIGAGAYVLLCAVEGARRGGGGRAGLRTALVFPVIHGGLAAGFLRGLLDVPRFRREPPRRGGSPT